MPGAASEKKRRAELTRALNALNSGRPTEAESPLRAVLKTSPRDTVAQSLLAMVLAQTGRPDEARTLIRKAIKREPARAPYHDTHGNILLALQQPAEAVAAYRRALTLDPAQAGTWFNLGRAQSLIGQFEAARESFGRVLAVQPQHLAALLQRGDLALRAGDLAAARQDLDAAVAIDGTSVAARVLLARTRQGLGFPDDALAVLTGDAPGVRAERARVFQSMGRLSEAQAEFEAALAARPGAVDAAGLAEVHLWLGDLTAARQVLEPYAAGDAPQVALMRARIALGERLPDGPPGDIDEGLKYWLARDGSAALDVALRRQTLFCLADIQHAREQTDAAFASYTRANATGGGTFDAAAHRAFVDALIAFYSSEQIGEMPRARGAAVGPVFIVGMPRSGTSLVEQVLGRHPLVDAHGERAEVAQLFAGLDDKDRGWAGSLAALDAGRLDALANRYLSARPVRDGVRWISDKMPQNLFYAGWIAQLFPTARIIVCRRADDAVALSCFRQNFLDPSLAFSDRLGDIASMMFDAQRIAEHWHSTLPVPITEVQYETLVDDFEPQVRRLLDALDLPFDERCLSFERSARFVNTASHAQVRRGLYRDALDQHRRYARHLAPFRLSLADLRDGKSGTP